jgi:hypothetical protein
VHFVDRFHDRHDARTGTAVLVPLRIHPCGGVIGDRPGAYTQKANGKDRNGYITYHG